MTCEETRSLRGPFFGSGTSEVLLPTFFDFWTDLTRKQAHFRGHYESALGMKADSAEHVAIQSQNAGALLKAPGKMQRLQWARH